MAAADAGSKWLIGHSPQAWVSWLLPDQTIRIEAELSTEFQFITRLSDSLLRVSGADGPFLILTEVQLRPDQRMPRRMRAYAALAEEKYDLWVYPVVFHLLPPRSGTDLATHYHSEQLGITAHQDFVVIKVWELEAAAVLEQENPALLPFVPLMKGADEATIRASAQRLRGLAGGERLETLLGLFASFVLDVETIEQIVRWNMNVLRESPWYQEILAEGMKEGLVQGLERGREEGLERGREEGLERGREEGSLQGQRQAILHFLRVRFYLQQAAEAELADRLAPIVSAADLQALVVAAAEAEKLADFMARLDEIAPLE